MGRLLVAGICVIGLLSAACNDQSGTATRQTIETSDETTVTSTTSATATTTSVNDAAIEARSLWESHDLDGYRYRAEHHSQWHRPGVWDILVLGDESVWMASLKGGEPASWRSHTNLFEIDRLFALIEEALPGTVTAVFDQEWGLPIHVSYDLPNAIDEEWSLYLSFVADEVPEPADLMVEMMWRVDAIFEGTVVGSVGDYVLLVEVDTVHAERPTNEPARFEGSVGVIDVREPNPIGLASDWVGEQIIVLGTLDNDAMTLSKKTRPDSLWLIRAAGVRTPEGLRALDDRFFTLDRRDICADEGVDTAGPDAEADLQFLTEWATQLFTSPFDAPLANACETIAKPDASGD